jgi:hypothetical protein
MNRWDDGHHLLVAVSSDTLIDLKLKFKGAANHQYRVQWLLKP